MMTEEELLQDKEVIKFLEVLVEYDFEMFRRYGRRPLGAITKDFLMTRIENNCNINYLLSIGMFSTYNWRKITSTDLYGMWSTSRIRYISKEFTDNYIKEKNELFEIWLEL